MTAPVVWTTDKDVWVRLPETRIELSGKPVVLPGTRRRLDRLVDAISWQDRDLQPREPSQWVDKPFYPKVNGRWAAADKAIYYTAEAWQAYQSLLKQSGDEPWENARSPHAKLLGVESHASREEIVAAFRRKAKDAHPDLGGDAALFRRLIVARDALLGAL